MIKLEQPGIRTEQDLAGRVAALERYLYRLAGQLQMALNALEQQKKGE